MQVVQSMRAVNASPSGFVGSNPSATTLEELKRKMRVKMKLTIMTEKLSKQIEQFISDAVADGWNIKPTYDDHESIETAASLEKDGYKIMVVNRIGEHIFNKPIHGWGPDSLSIDINIVYDWKQITAATNICGECKQEKSFLQRVGFANRVCNDCLPEARKRLEYPGWTK